MYKIYTVSFCTGRDLSQAEKTVGDGEKSTMPRTNFVVLYGQKTLCAKAVRMIACRAGLPNYLREPMAQNKERTLWL
jgi:hypothetical protein